MGCYAICYVMGLVGKPSPRCVLNYPWAVQWKGPMTVYFGHDTARGMQVHKSAIGIDTGPSCYVNQQLILLFLIWAICKSIHPSVDPSIHSYRSIHPSVDQSIHLSIHPSISHHCLQSTVWWYLSRLCVWWQLNSSAPPWESNRECTCQESLPKIWVRGTHS